MVAIVRIGGVFEPSTLPQCRSRSGRGLAASTLPQRFVHALRWPIKIREPSDLIFARASERPGPMLSLRHKFPHFALLAMALSTAAPASGQVIARHLAASAGLERPWFTQVQLDPATQTVAGAQVEQGRLYVLTSAGTLQAFDAETGATLWTRRFGDPTQIAAGPDVRGDRVAVVIGSTVFVLDAETGEELLVQETEGAPGGAAALGDKFVYVAQASNRLVGYPYDTENTNSFTVASPGRLQGTPVVSETRVLWPTQRGELYAAPAAGGSAIYRFEASTPLSGPPSLFENTLIFATYEGMVHSLHTERGRTIWRTSVSGSVSQPVSIAAGLVFIATDSPTLVALKAATGQQQWAVDGLKGVVSVSEGRVYAMAPNGGLGILDRESGRPVGSLPISKQLAPVVNTQSDRLYLISETGLLQCLREEGLKSPYLHAGTEAAETPEAPAAPSPVETPDESGESGFDVPADEPPAAGDPFSDDPFSEEGSAGDDPFGGDPFGGF